MFRKSLIPRILELNIPVICSASSSLVCWVFCVRRILTINLTSYKCITVDMMKTIHPFRHSFHICALFHSPTVKLWIFHRCFFVCSFQLEVMSTQPSQGIATIKTKRAKRKQKELNNNNN